METTYTHTNHLCVSQLMTSQSTMTTHLHKVALHQTDRQFSSFEAAQGGNWRAMRARGKKGQPSWSHRAQECRCAFCLFCLFVCFKNSVSFQITDPLINLAEVERGPLILRNQHGRPLLDLGRPVYQQPPPPAAPWSALRPLAVCLPAGLPAWRRVKRLSWTWRMEPCTEWPVGYVERAWS